MTDTIDMPHTAESPESVTSDSSASAASHIASDQTAATPVVAVQSAGELLREARAASGMHIATLSMALKVPVKKLEALEADDWTTLPDPVFVRALATSVCRHIKTDSVPILSLLPKNPSPVMVDESAAKGLNQRFIAATDPKQTLLRLPVSIPMMLGAVIFLLAALVLMFLPDLVQRTAAKKTEVVEVATPAAVLPPQELSSAPMVPAVIVSTPTPEVAAVASPAPAPVITTSASNPTTSVTSLTAKTTPPASLPVASVSAVPAQASSVAIAVAPNTPPIATPSTLRMVAKGVVWVEVKDAKGVLLVQRTLQPKEVVSASGLAPLAVVVGRINEMQSIDVRGKPFSLAGLSPDNVARFQVK
jgi:cytoskeleton protein RodZ